MGNKELNGRSVEQKAREAASRMDYERTLFDLAAWKRRQDRCNGFSANKFRDGSNLLEDNFETIVLALSFVIGFYKYGNTPREADNGK